MRWKWSVKTMWAVHDKLAQRKLVEPQPVPRLSLRSLKVSWKKSCYLNNREIVNFTRISLELKSVEAMKSADFLKEFLAYIATIAAVAAFRAIM